MSSAAIPTFSAFPPPENKDYMCRTVQRCSLELEVSDFGPIARANIDLRPFTVFVGPSNTGKSWLSILIYALHRFFGGHGKGTTSTPTIFRVGESQDVSTETRREILDTYKRIHGTDELESGAIVPIPARVAKRISSEFESRGEMIDYEIRRCFGVAATHDLIRKSAKRGARIVMKSSCKESSCTVHKIALTKSRTALKMDIPQALVAGSDAVPDGHEFFNRISWHQILLAGDPVASSMGLGERELVRALSDRLLPRIAAPLHMPAYYLPADRTGVMHAHSVVVNALIGNAPHAGLHPPNRTPALSGVLADFLSQLIEIDRAWPPRGERQAPDLGKPIEDTVLRGSIHLNRSPTIDYPNFSYHPEGWKNALSLHHASSMVSELAPVVLYLRHLVERNNVLIIEEPESHLHPGMQVELTRQLAKLVDAGIRIIVTTHSEWLLEELANLVKRSELSRQEHGGKGTLRPEQVGAWLFEPKNRPRGSVIREISLGESGTYPSGFDDVAVALHNDWAEISSSIEAGS